MRLFEIHFGVDTSCHHRHNRPFAQLDNLSQCPPVVQAQMQRQRFFCRTELFHLVTTLHCSQGLCRQLRQVSAVSCIMQPHRQQRSPSAASLSGSGDGKGGTTTLPGGRLRGMPW